MFIKPSSSDKHACDIFESEIVRIKIILDCKLFLEKAPNCLIFLHAAFRGVKLRSIKKVNQHLQAQDGVFHLFPLMLIHFEIH